MKLVSTLPRPSNIPDLVAEWIHFTLFVIVLPTIKLKVCTFWGLMNPATKLNPGVYLTMR